MRVDGDDVRDLTQDSLHAAVGLVAQDPHLFHDTIRANLTSPGPTRPTPTSKRALRAARIWDVVAALPDGLDTVVGERGYRMSGGEKQRLAIARVLLKDPAIVILDEATSHLDSESELAIQRALDDALRGPHRDRHRPPAVDDRRRRPHPRRRRRPDRRDRHARRIARTRRHLRRSVQQPAPSPRGVGLKRQACLTQNRVGLATRLGAASTPRRCVRPARATVRLDVDRSVPHRCQPTKSNTSPDAQRLVARRRRYRWTGVLVASVIVGAAGTVAAFAYTDADAPAPTRQPC